MTVCRLQTLGDEYNREEGMLIVVNGLLVEREHETEIMILESSEHESVVLVARDFRCSRSMFRISAT